MCCVNELIALGRLSVTMPTPRSTRFSTSSDSPVTGHPSSKAAQDLTSNLDRYPNRAVRG